MSSTAATPGIATEDQNRLKNTFQDQPLSAHGSAWDSLWTESYTPWDRGGPSAALDDLLTSRRDIFPSSGSSSGGTKKRALVPGCGRGYDALLLAAHGYDVCGMDYSATATKEAIETEKKTTVEGRREAAAGGPEKGKVTWVTGDFFADGFLEGAGAKTFDVIFDYTVSFFPTRPQGIYVHILGCLSSRITPPPIPVFLAHTNTKRPSSCALYPQQRAPSGPRG